MISEQEAAAISDESFRAGALAMGQAIQNNFNKLRDSGATNITADSASKLTEAVMGLAGIIEIKE